MNREYYPEIFQKIWHAQPRANMILRQEVDIDVQFKILSTFGVGDFYWYIINLEDFSFEYISPEIEKMLGYRVEDITPEDLIESIHPEDISFFINAENTVKKFFSKLPYDKYFNYKIRYDFRIRKSDGDFIRILQQVIPIVCSQEGTVIKTLGVHTDITYLKTHSHPNLSFIDITGEESFLDFPIENYIHEKHSFVFTKREQEILCLLWEGLESKQIACKLFISKVTVDKHRRNMLSKCSAFNTIELIRYALSIGEL